MAFLSRVGLQTRMVVAVVMGLGVILGVLGYFGLQSVRQSTDLVINERVTLARTVAAEIDETITHVSLELETMAAAARDGPDSYDFVQARDALKEFYYHLTIHHHITLAGASAIGIVGQDGNILWMEPEVAWSFVLTPNVSGRPIIQRALKSGGSTFGEAVIPYSPVLSMISVVTPVTAQSGKVLGLFFLDMDPLSGIASLNPSRGLGEIGYPVEVINEEGAVLAAMGGDEIAEVISHHLDLVRSLMGEGKVGGAIHEDHIVAYVPLRTAPWGVVLEQKGDIALMLPNTLRTRLLIFGSFATLAALFLAWLSTRMIVGPIKDLTMASRRIAAGELDKAVTPSRFSSLGEGYEISLLAQAFDEMRVKLKASQEELAAWNQELEGRVEQRTQELSALFESSKAFASTLELEEVLQSIMAQTQKLCPGANAGALFLHDKGLRQLVGRASFGLYFQTPPTISLDAQGGAVSSSEQFKAEHCSVQAFLTRQPRLCPTRELPAEPEIEPPKILSLPELPPRTGAMCVPILYEDQALGVLNLYKADPPGAFSELEVQLIQSLTNQAAIAIENARLFKEASMVGTLRELDRLKTEFVARASHELRTPLTSIKSLAETLLRKDLTLKPSEVREFLEGINSASDRLARIISDLLTVSRIESRRLEVRKVPTQIGPIIKRVVEQFRFQSPSKVFKLVIPPELPPALADPDRLEDVINNLLSNAVKYSPLERPVTVGAYLAYGAEEASLEMKGPSLVISVTDEGGGIALEDRGKLFQRFSRVDNQATRAAPGVGLGLYISKAYVEAMGGAIWVDSRVGEGSTFTFQLPVAQARPEEESRQETKISMIADRSVRGSLILVVDDEEDVLKTVQVNLRAHGFRVLTASNGEECLALVKRRKPALILLDIVMPGLDGFEVAKGLKEDPETQDIPILFLTARAQEEDEVIGKAAGATAYIKKPFSPIQLCDTVREVLVSHRRPSEEGLRLGR